jgi:calcineurin-like phosphoesterase family protein
MPELAPRYLHLRPTPGKEAALLHGHIHSEWLTRQHPGKPLMINLGVEMWGMRPVSEAMLVDVFQNRQRNE